MLHSPFLHDYIVKLSPVCAVQLPSLLGHGQGQDIVLISHAAPDAASTAQLQQTVDSSHACITVLVIPAELITHTDRHLAKCAIEVALADLSTPHAVLVMQAAQVAPEAGVISNHLPELSMHSVLDSACSFAGKTMAAVTAKVRATVMTAMGDCTTEQAELEDDEPLLAAGLTSAGAVQMVRLLEEDFDMTLPDTLAFDYPTVADLAAQVVALLPTTGSTADLLQGAASVRGDISPALAAATTAATAAALTTTSAALVPQSDSMTAVEGPEQSKLLRLVLAAAAEALDSSSGQDAGPPPLQEPLMEAGLTSAGAVQLVALLEAATGLELPGTLAFDYPTIAEITGYLQTLQTPSQTPLPASGGHHTTSDLQGKAAACDAEASHGGQTAGAAALQSEIVSTVFAAVAGVLGLTTAEIGELGLDTPLMDAGLASSMAIQLATQLESALQMDLPGTLAFDYPTIRDMAAFLEPLAAAAAAPSVQTTAQTPAPSGAVDTSGTPALSSTICDAVEDILGGPVGLDIPLLDAGLTSAAVQLTAALEEALDTELPGTLIFDYPTIASLVAYLATCTSKLPSSSPAVPSLAHTASASSSSPASTAGGTPGADAAAVFAAQVPKQVSATAAYEPPRAIAIVSSAHRVPGGGVAAPCIHPTSGQGHRCASGQMGQQPAAAGQPHRAECRLWCLPHWGRRVRLSSLPPVCC